MKHARAGCSPDPGPLVLPPQRARAASSAITIEHAKMPAAGRMPFSETHGDRCRLTIALRHGQVRVLRNGSMLHAGAVLPGMMRLTGPGDRVSGEVLSAMEAVVIDLPPDRVRPLLPDSVGLSSVDPILQHSAQAEQLGRSLLGLRHFDARHRGLFGGGVIVALLAVLLDWAGRAGRPPTAGFSPEQVTAILAFADQRIGSPLDLDQWAARFGLPTAEFARRFKRATGSAPYAYFLRRRVERAQALMTETASTLSQIALEVGFGSQSHFTDAFHRVTGSPGRWRRAQATSV